MSAADTTIVGSAASDRIGQLAQPDVASADCPGQHQIEQDQRVALRVGRQLLQRLFTVSRVGHEKAVQLQQLRESLSDVVAILDDENGSAFRGSGHFRDWTQLHAACHPELSE